MDRFFFLLSKALDRAQIPNEIQVNIRADLWKMVRKDYPYLVREDAIIQLRKNGQTQRAIAQKLKMSLREVNQLCKKYNLARIR